MSRQHDDSPYRDEASHPAPARGTTGRTAARAPTTHSSSPPRREQDARRGPARGRQQTSAKQRPAAKPDAPHVAKHPPAHAAKGAASHAATPAAPRAAKHHAAAMHVAVHVDGHGRKPAAPERARSSRAAAPETDGAPKARRRSRRSRSGSPYAAAAKTRLTSHPTDRNAYAETRLWLLAEHGPVCAYCGLRFDKAAMTLDHVAPRRGQTAYDRRDNLVLACQPCNAAKRDLAPAAFLLGNRNRAVHLLRYGSHLSPMLVELARSLVPAGTVIEPVIEPARLPARERHTWGSDDDGDSPYAD